MQVYHPAPVAYTIHRSKVIKVALHDFMKNCEKNQSGMEVPFSAMNMRRCFVHLAVGSKGAPHVTSRGGCL